MDKVQLLLFSHSVITGSLEPHGMQHTRFPCPQSLLKLMSIESVCHPTISSSVAPFSFCLQSFPASRSFPVSWLFISGGQSIGTSALASVLSMNIQGWFPLELTSLISFLSKGLSRVYSSTTVWKLGTVPCPLWVCFLDSTGEVETQESGVWKHQHRACHGEGWVGSVWVEFLWFRKWSQQ